MQEQVTHVRCPACRSTVRVFDSQCWVCGTELAATPRDNVVIDATTQDVAPAEQHGFDAITRRFAHVAPPGARDNLRALIPVGALRTVNERTYFRRAAPRQPAGGQQLLPAPAARIAHLAPPSPHARRNSAVQPLMVVAAMVFLSVAAMTIVGRYAPQPVAAENAISTALTVSTVVLPTVTAISSRVATEAPLAADTSAPLMLVATLTAPAATPTPRPVATAARALAPAATVQATRTTRPRLNATSTQAAQSATTYQVKRGDTCSEIARAFNISLNSLSEFNKLDARCRLLAGQTLTIPAVQR
jgi:LysM repeat protein